jgi:hypothetical protein
MCVQIAGPTNGERTIARVNAAGGQIIECGKDGTCMFHSFLVGAILNPAMEPAVSHPHRLAGRSRSVYAALLCRRCAASLQRACVLVSWTR